MKRQNWHLRNGIWMLMALLLVTACRTTRHTDAASMQTAAVTIKKEPTRKAAYPNGRLQTQLDSLTHTGLFDSTTVAMCVYDLTSDQLLYSINATQRLRPASNMKLLTAITALDILDTAYHYRPTVITPGWGWCWDDEETGIQEFEQKGKRWSADTLFHEDSLWTLLEVMQPMMKKSHNLLAESLFAQLPTRNDSASSDRKACVEPINELLRKTGLNPDNYTIADGSGLSLYNYLSAEALLAVLRYAYAHPNIYSNLYPALPIAGVDGTLRRRMKGTAAEGNVHAKTGSVTGISTLSGYCTTKDNHTLAFSIMNSGLQKGIDGRNFQDRICVTLCETPLE